MVNKTGRIFDKIVTVSVSVSVLTLTFISVERWYAICFPLKFKATTSRAKRAIIAIWFISLTVDIPELIVLHAKPRTNLQVETIYFTQCVPDWGGVADITYCIFRIVLLYFLPLAFMSFAYYQIARVLWSSTNIPGDGARRLDTSLANGNTQVQYSTRREFPFYSPAIRIKTLWLLSFKVPLAENKKFKL
ncbi:unnamed protein product [Allacma fusca]|uniref:G-protein coupled receptors family 1 profile domain-containing protein n=1 Tax=Allacma fusca TaxID=39272 RepID=A0A8J2L6I6_9HEXA|nr:unnamed protein product [Allacma fusca]